MLRILESGSAAFDAALLALERRGESDLDRVEPEVRRILGEVRTRGDAALRTFAKEFEGRDQGDVLLDGERWRAQASSCDSKVRTALEQAAERIAAYHAHQVERGFSYEEGDVELGHRVLPLRSAGVYAPGGKARYPSSVLMTAVPARVAGVKRIVLATPSPTPEVLAAALVAGVTEVVDAGGAQAIAALAYGTESVRRVDKIVGPGNLYVAAAKRLVFGTVDIDQIAGPSEILVFADGGADPVVVAADLLSQAEHDEDAYALLVTTDAALAQAARDEVDRQLATLPRSAIARVSIENHGTCFVTKTLDEALDVINRLAPEHLALLARDAAEIVPRVEAAGAIFVGDHTPEAAGDYVAGPSHVLPTGGAARHSSPLGVYDFVVRSSVIRYGPKAIAQQADLIEGLARLEGLEGHARAVSVRRKLPERS